MDKTQYDGGTDEDTYGSPNKRVARAGNSQENEGDSGSYSRGEQENGTYTYGALCIVRQFFFYDIACQNVFRLLHTDTPVFHISDYIIQYICQFVKRITRKYEKGLRRLYRTQTFYMVVDS